jgi:hypothetical protein
MNVTVPAADDFDLPAASENLGEEVHILALDPKRLAKLQDWSLRLNLTPEEFLLKSFDLLCGRLEQASRRSGEELTPGNPRIFKP